MATNSTATSRTIPAAATDAFPFGSTSASLLHLKRTAAEAELANNPVASRHAPTHASTAAVVASNAPAMPRPGTCTEMAICLNSSDEEEEDDTDVPVHDIKTTTRTVVPAGTEACVIPSATATATSNFARAAGSGGGSSTGDNVKPSPSKLLFHAAGTSSSPDAASRTLHHRAGVPARKLVVLAPAQPPGASALGAAASGTAAGHNIAKNGGGGGVLKSEYGIVDGGRTASPNTKKKIGRPMGRKNRSLDNDPPYVAPNASERDGVDEGYVAKAANRPRRAPGPRRRWADEMMNPGEQWLRKPPKPAPMLPPNPVDASIPDAPTFYPTPDEFRDPLSFIESIRPRAESFGIAKIVPPEGWKPPVTPMNTHLRKRVPTKKQALHSLMNSDEVYDEGREFSILEYKMMADRFATYWAGRAPPEPKERASPPFAPRLPKVEIPAVRGTPTPQVKADAKAAASRLRHLEREYWNIVDGSLEEAEVEYANDLDISQYWSGFPIPPKNFMNGSSFDRTAPCRLDDSEYYRTCGWNLNNLPFWPGSVLRFFRTHVNGLTAPWLYLGMQFATFAWHNEDNYLYSLNYHHSGAPKQWYGVPGKHAKGFEACLAKLLGETLETVSEHLYRITKALSPVYLQEANVPVCRLEQHPGQFVVTFPKAYHGGFSYGFNCGEAVNFAVPDWISYSRESTEAYRSAARMAALSHDKMVATLTMYLPDYDVNGCELVVRELKRIQTEELRNRYSLETQGVQDPADQGVPLPRFRLGLIERDTEEYDERRVCKTCKHTLFMTGVACHCSDVDVSCLRCVRAACDCKMSDKYLLSWWTRDDLSRFVATADTYLTKLREGTADAAAVAAFRASINPF